METKKPENIHPDNMITVFFSVNKHYILLYFLLQLACLIFLTLI